jgi:hypothetical protein
MYYIKTEVFLTSLIRARCFSDSLVELKGLCHEICDLWFYHQTTPSGPLIHVGLFAYRFEFAKKFDFKIADFDVNDTADHNFF